MTKHLDCARATIAQAANSANYLALRKSRVGIVALAMIAGSVGFSIPSQALPTFARQTSKTCVFSEHAISANISLIHQRQSRLSLQYTGYERFNGGTANTMDLGGPQSNVRAT
jgi:hypothetical protein